MTEQPDLPSTWQPPVEWLMADETRWLTYLAGMQRAYEDAAGDRNQARDDGFVDGFMAGYVRANEEFAAEVYGDQEPAMSEDPYVEDPTSRTVHDREAEQWDAGRYGDLAGQDLVDHFEEGQFHDEAGAA